MPRALIAFVLASLALGLAACRTAERVDFNVEIRPILNERCVSCHGGVRRRAGLSLLFRDDALRGGDSGRPAVVPGDPGSSELMRLVRHSDPDERMPREDDPLSDVQIERLKAWIDQGADWETHWAYVAPSLPGPPTVEETTWPRSTIDRFVLARLEEERLSHAPEADCRVLARRASLDLVGLPADPGRVDGLCGSDDGPVADDAWAVYVDELLASPFFGERWASLWLDLARYADSKGYEKDSFRSIWRWRDWVIRAFSDDMPFDRFTIEQLAGDLLPDATADQVLATAFHRNAMTNEEGGTDDEEHRTAAVIDRVNTTWEVWQGTTMGCAQCHGHPYDPFRHEDYYRSFAVFNNTADWDQPSEEPLLREFDETDTARARQIEEAIAALDNEIRRHVETADGLAALREWEESLDDPKVSGALSTTAQNEVLRIAAIAPDDRSVHQEAFIRARFAEVHPSTEDLRAQRSELAGRLDSLTHTTTPVLRELPPDRARTTRLLERGSFLTPGSPVEPGVPGFMLQPESDDPMDRLAFARWLVADRNPLTARVAVNRFWEQLFGIGIVATTDDFGTAGLPPSHPDLLDWLAVTFRTDMGWSVKTLLREIVRSSTYRQSSAVTHDRDPDNRLLSRGPRVRLSAEQLRDQALAAGGLLSPKRFGPPVMPPQPDGIWKNPYSGERWTTVQGEDRYRRAVYTRWRRTGPYPSMVAFDAPSREFCVSRRIRTNTPLQALVTLNDPAFWEAAVGLGARMLREDGTDRERLAAGYRLVLARPVHASDLDVLERLLIDARLAGAQTDSAFALAANVLLNLDAVITRE